MNKHQAMILAAGFGKRMHPLTLQTPKPLIKVQGKSFLERMLENINNSDMFDHVVINCHYLKEQIIEFVETHRHLYPKIKIDISVEEERDLETGGGVRNALHFFDLNKPIFVINSDNIFPYHSFIKAIKNLEQNFYSNNAMINLLSILLKKVIPEKPQGDYDIIDGIIAFDQDRNYMYCGIQLLNPDVFSYYKGEDNRFSFREIFKPLAKQAKLFSTIYDGYFANIEDIYSLQALEEAIEQEKLCL